MATPPAPDPDVSPDSPRAPAASGRRHRWAIVLALLALGLVVLIALWDWNWFKGPVERQVEARTGRSFAIEGDLDVDLDWSTPTIRADGIRFGNAPWSRRPVMASAEGVEFTIRLWPLFKRQVVIPSLRLDRPELHLEMGPQRTGNWKFGEEGESRTRFSGLWIDEGKLTYTDAATKTDFAIDAASERSHARRNAGSTSAEGMSAEGTSAKGKPARSTPAGSAPAGIAIRGGGRWKGAAFRVEGRGESPLQLQDKERPYRVDVRASAGTTRAHARGTLVDPVRLRDFDVQFALSGQDLEDLYPLLGIVTPPTPPYRLDGRLTRDIEGRTQTWHYRGFKGRVGDSDVSGDASIEVGGERPFLRADVASQRLDFDDLAGFIGKAPSSAGGESTNPELAAQAAEDRASARLLPDRPYRLDKLRAMDADVRFRAKRINASKWPLDDMETHLLLENGVLRLDPLNFGIAGGNVRSVIRMDARESPIRTRAEISARGLQLPRLIPQARFAKGAAGAVGGKVALAGQGNSIAKMLGTSDGDVVVGMGRGKISNLMMELAGLDIAESLKFLVQGDKQIPIRCAFGDFGVQDGTMTSRSLAFDTTDTIIVGEGTVSLRDETLDLRLRPRPKDRSLLSLRVPLRVDGSFKDPEFRPDLARMGLRGALALTLANIAPPAAFLATLETGPGEDVQCGGRYAK